MKKLVISSLLLITANVFAYSKDITGKGELFINDLVDKGVTTVVATCSQEYLNNFPRCILIKKCHGIQYEGQAIKDVDLTCHNNVVNAVKHANYLAENNLCKKVNK